MSDISEVSIQDASLYQNLEGEANSPYLLSKKLRPFDAIENVLNKLKSCGEEVCLAAGETMNLSEDEQKSRIILVYQGIFRVHSCRLDERKSDIHFGLMRSPNIVGFVDGYADMFNLNFRLSNRLTAETDCAIRILTPQMLAQKVDEHDIWRDISKILAHRLLVLLAKQVELNGYDAYKKIRSLLLELWVYPEQIRKETNVLAFIQSRTSISRSQIMKILAELKAGKYIRMSNGRLQEMCRLPKSF